MTHEHILNIKDITALGKCITVCFTYNSILSINYLHPNIRLKSLNILCMNDRTSRLQNVHRVKRFDIFWYIVIIIYSIYLVQLDLVLMP